MTTTYYTYYNSPIGKLLLAGDGDSLAVLGFPGGKMQRRHEPHWIEDEAAFKQVTAQLAAYFKGELQVFDLVLAPRGTDFQMSVWQALQEIPYGTTWSYGELARRIGKPKASRAVGAANGRNPIPVIIPCHRVIGGSGKLTGFGGGLETKQFLLGHERVRIQGAGGHHPTAATYFNLTLGFQPPFAFCSGCDSRFCGNQNTCCNP